MSAEEKVKMEVLLNNIEIEIKNVEHIIKEFFEISAINQNKGNLYSNNNPVNQPYNNQQYPNNNPINPPQNPYPPQYPNNNPVNPPYNNQQYPNNNHIYHHNFYHQQRNEKILSTLGQVGCILAIISYVLLSILIIPLVFTIPGIIMCNNIRNGKAESKTLAGIWALIFAGIIPGVFILCSEY
ncbi:hypothetical protein [Candidatus Phytoplasma solani]|uniref:hypothetical protein n=1 Tax=Candidatus Phytoplasma solani TaxID=69896 RepID=UPI00358E7106